MPCSGGCAPSLSFVRFPMRPHFSRPAFFEGVRDMTPVLIGIVPFGMVCGIAAVSAGASPLAALAMSAIMFSGAAQIVAAQLLSAGAPLLVIVLSCLVVGLRFLVYSAAMAPYLRPLDHRWRNILSFVLTDQAFAGTIQRFRESGDLRANASYFLGGGVLLWVVWQLATLAGILVGQVIPALVAARVCRALVLPRDTGAAVARPRQSAGRCRGRCSARSHSMTCRCACR